MHRQPLLKLLKRFSSNDSIERSTQQRFIQFVEQEPRCFERKLEQGHVTASAWILNPERTEVLLTHHRKLQKWVQPGGHADGDCDILAVSMREAEEESGLTHIQTISNDILSLDIHLIPTHGAVPQHFHYDVTFALQATRNTDFIVSAESIDLKWVKLEDLENYSSEDYLLRMRQHWISGYSINLEGAA